MLVKELGSSCTRATGDTVLRAGPMPMIEVRSARAPMTLVRQTDDVGTARRSRTDGKGTLSYSKIPA